jgi:NAD(P)-dependent dehydrogenase (short-subunit alcohol dehydrogenase family)
VEINGTFVQVDVADEGSVTAMYAAASAAHGGIDILFNNAGISPPEDDSILATDLSAWEKVQLVNLTSVYLCCRIGIPYLVARGAAR